MAVQPATDTIAAIATAPGTGGIGIIRISGTDALSLLQQIFLPYKPHSQFTSHRLYYGTVLGLAGQVLDEALAVYMRAPHTYTCEDVVELHCHGSYIVLQEVLRTVFERGARPAEQGEFTKRAFLAGRIDLTRAEAVVDLLHAQTEKGAQLAANQLQGALFTQLEAIRHQLVRILALLEVAIDFPDDDVEIVQRDQVLLQLQNQIVGPLVQLLAMADQGRIVREGIKVVLAGQPNVGKSSLLNGLLQEDRALVTSVPGTTRDTIEERFVIRGIPVHLIDTAGIRTHEDPVEALGIERARQKMQQADLVLYLIDGQAGLSATERALYQTISDKAHIVVINKSDLVTTSQIAAMVNEFPQAPVVSISAKHQLGMEDLQEAIYQRVIGEGAELCEQMTCAPNTRHKAILSQTLAACRSLETALGNGAPVDLLAVEVQSALDYLGDITGLTTPDDVLDLVFSQFCIGK
ncbi:MAG: tRNA uridine-5-carboxymethylaminomethyl(34) synthesis GTPase MnmE [Desulfobulbus sp.]|nr:tRNA uridine-5-carboxymethylaminomethyl(34) synthesis GTPase MnmE [Desulfobulbus sp.]